MESEAQWLARIGSPEALESRMQMRIAGKLNVPIKGMRSLGNVVAQMAGTPTTVGHSWSCECELCRPWLWRGDDKVTSDRAMPTPAPARQVQKIEPPKCKKGFKEPRKKWSEQRGRSSN